MFWRILKKDLKRKKTMNIVLLLFVIMCSMFAAASVNNIIAVTGGIEHYFDMADVPDMTAMISAECDAEERIRELPSVKEVKTEHYLFVLGSKNFKLNGERMDNFFNPAGLISDKEMAINYFDENNDKIQGVEKGWFYANSPFLQGIEMKAGDEVELTVGDTTLKMKYKGRFKGALFSSDNTSNPILILNSEDYDVMDKEEQAHSFYFNNLYIRTTSPDEIKNTVKDYSCVSLSTRKESKAIYLYDMIAAYILMAISIVLMITAFIVMRFTIDFTISEEFREIGVMKAVGVGNGSIRWLYIVKYLAVAAVGSAIGFAGSIPLQSMMMKTVSENMVLSSENGIAMGAMSSAAVVVIIMLFCYGCTRKVKKMSPIDAVRNGQTGERFGRKSIMHLGSSKLPSTGFMALNDICSAPKRFGIITVIFTLCMLMMMLMSNFAMTLKSEKILWLFGIPTSEAHIMEGEYFGEVLTDFTAYKKIIKDTEKLLEENGMPGRCTMTLNSSYEASYKDKKTNLNFWMMKGETDDTLRVDEGYAPGKDNEIAMTVSALKELGAEIGDTITVETGDRKYDFIITGRYSGFTTKSAMVNKDFDFGSSRAEGVMGVQIHFDGSPDKETINKNVEKLRELISSEKVYNTSDMIKSMTGMSDTLNSIKKMMMILTVIVTAMIVVLMERSFISKEKSELALMKAVGISNGSIIGQHSLRFVFVSILSALAALAVLMPLSNFMMNKVCLLIGDVSGIKCDMDPMDIFVICPIILIGVTVIGAWLTALYTKTIKASDTASIE